MAFSVVLFDDYPQRAQLFPFVATRPIGDLRIGAYTLNNKWAKIFNTDVSYRTPNYLSELFPYSPIQEDILVLNSIYLPSTTLIQTLENLSSEKLLIDSNGDWIAIKLFKSNLLNFDISDLKNYETIVSEYQFEKLKYVESLFIQNSNQIIFDVNNLLDKFEVIEKKGLNNVFLGNNIFIHPNLSFNSVSLDSTKGPIYIDKGVILEPQTVIYGPVYIGENTRIKSGTVLYPNVTIGPNCTIAGELNNVVIWGNTAKGHSGYLGCSVVGEECNIGASSNNSNLKNDWSTVKLYDYFTNRYRDTGISKCGVFIGDQTMLAIGSKINTGTIIGVGVQLAISDFIPKFVADFSWFTEDRKENYIFARFQEMLKRKAALKNEDFNEKLINIYKEISLAVKELKDY